MSNTTINSSAGGTNFTSEDREKLDSIEVGARVARPDIVKLAYAVEKATGGGGGSGGGTGDSEIWVGTTSFQETIDVLVPQPTWRSNGYIEWDFSAEFKNDGGGTETVTFKLQRAYPPVTLEGTPSGDFGALQAFEDVSGLSFTSKPIPDGVGMGTMTFTLRVRSLGHVGEVQRHSYSGVMLCTNLGGGDPVRTDFVGTIETSGTAAPYDGLDTTEDLEIRAMFKMDSPWAVNANNLFNVTSAGAMFVPRSGHPY